MGISTILRVSLAFSVVWSAFSQECGSDGSTTSILNANSLDSIQNCSVLKGNLFVRSRGPSTDLENLVLPSTLSSVIGTVFCSGAGVNWTLNSITAQGLNAVASQPSSFPTTGFVISDYANLTKLSFPNLTTVGSNVILLRNPLLKIIDGFGLLTTVHGNLDITGNFDSLVLTNLAAVNGSINIQTTSASFVCPDFSNVSVIGNINCHGKVAEPQPLSNDNSTTSLPSNISPTNSVPSTTQLPTSTVTGGSTTLSPSSSVASTSSAELRARNEIFTCIFYVAIMWVGLRFLLL